MIQFLKNYFGFIKEEEITATYPDAFNFTDNLDLKTEYLKTLDAQENDRRASIDTKTSQLIGQTGIIFSIVSLFITNFISKFNSWHIWFQVLIIAFFLITLGLYLMAIIKATEYLNIHKYKYGQRNVSTVSQVFASEEAFKTEEIKDMIYSIERNTKVTNQKCNNLVYAHRFFRVGTISVGILSVLMILSAYITSPAVTTTIKLEQPISIKGIDSLSYILRDVSNKVNKQKISPVRESGCRKKSHD
jgi:hypothetical protein